MQLTKNTAPGLPSAVVPVRSFEEARAHQGIPLSAAAMQFSTGNRRVAFPICGIPKPESGTHTLEWANWPISDEAWAEITSLPFGTDNPEANRVYNPC